MKKIMQFFGKGLKVQMTNKKTLSRKFVGYMDANNDWLEVRYQDLVILGIENEISKRSSRLRDHVYLMLPDDYEIFMTYYKMALHLSHEEFERCVKVRGNMLCISAIAAYPHYYVG